MLNIKINTDNLRQLKDALPKGWGVEIARKTGLSTNTVSKTLNGHLKNSKVIEEAYRLLAKEIKRIDRQNKLHEKLKEYEQR